MVGGLLLGLALLAAGLVVCECECACDSKAEAAEANVIDAAAVFGETEDEDSSPPRCSRTISSFMSARMQNAER